MSDLSSGIVQALMDDAARDPFREWPISGDAIAQVRDPELRRYGLAWIVDWRSLEG